MSYPLITRKQLADRVGQSKLDRAFDDAGSGEAEDDPIDLILRNASGKVLGKLKGMYPIDTIRAMPADDMDDELVRVTLDQAVALLSQRSPEVMQNDWEALMRQADKDLKELRLNERGLSTEGSPEPPANVGGGIQGAQPDSPAGALTFGCGFGSF